jgi:hypothetical protein
MMAFKTSVNVLNKAGDIIDPATETTIKLLKRIVKLLEAGGTVDIRNRQRVVLDGVGTGTTGVTTELAAALPVTGTFYQSTQPVSGTLGTAITGGGNMPVAGPPYTIGAFQPQCNWEGPVDQRWRVAEDAHISYQLGIRSHLKFT